MSEYQPTILIVDDTAETVRLLSNVLVDIGRILFALNGRSVYEMMEQQEIDMILMEVNLPDMSGFELCQRLMVNRHYKHVLILFITTRDEAKDQILGLSLGAVDYITKPFDTLALRHRILNHLKHSHLRRELIRTTTIDRLTGVGNRSQFFENLAATMAHCSRQQRYCSLIVLDIDHFRRINRRLGLAMADRALIQLTGLIREQMGIHHTFYRIGDDEFALILADTDLDSSRIFAEQLRLNIRQSQHGFEPGLFLITACFGVTQAKPGEIYNKCYLRADAALQDAKRKGRNRVEVADYSNDML